MKRKLRKYSIFLSTAILTLSVPMTVLADNEAEPDPRAAAGNLFVWFLCAIAFLKVSQKIDSFMSSLGVNVGRTGGSMMAELLIAARGLTSARNMVGGGDFGGGFSRGGGGMGNASLFAGGLAGAVGRRFTQSAMNTMTGRSNNPITRRAFESSMRQGGDFANGVTSAVAQGNISYTGSMTGPQAAQALSSYLGHTGMADAPSFSDVEIGGGRIMGTETSVDHPNGAAFGMYSTDQYMAPDGEYETITTADNATWYRQYATDTVERTPYMTGEGKIAYHENIVQKLPNLPKRKDRV